MEVSVYEVKDIMRIMRVSRNTAYKMIKQGGIPYIRIGSQYKIPTERFHEWLSGRFAHLQCVTDDATMNV